MAQGSGRKVKKHCRTPGRMRTRVTYEYADGPEQQRAIGVLAQMMEDCARRLAAEKKRAVEPNEGIKRCGGRGAELDSSSYAVYTMKGRASCGSERSSGPRK